MSEFSKAELEDAQKAIAPSIRKIEKAKETLAKKAPLPKAQLTLAARNLKALEIAMSLIMQELSR